MEGETARTDPVARAREYGIDISLLQANLQRSVTDRLRSLDANVAFLRGARVRP